MKTYDLTLIVNKPDISLVADIKAKGASREDAELQALLIIEEQIVGEFDYKWFDDTLPPTKIEMLKAETERMRKLFDDNHGRS